MQTSQVLSLSPSFNTYSSSRLTEIAARVVEEFRNEQQSEIYYDHDDDYYRCSTEDSAALEKSSNVESLEKPRTEEEEKDGEEEEGDFEFSFVCRDPELSPISADEIFYNGQIKPVFPLFNTDLLLGDDEVVGSESVPKPSRRLSLGKLMTEDRDPPSCSSSEADELEGLPPGTYCVWMPKKEEKEAGKCKKSNSTGSSKRWRFRDLLNRSNSDGKDTFVFLTQSASAKAKKNEVKVEKSVSAGDGGKFTGIPKSKGVSVGGEGEIPVTSCHEANYVRNRRAMKEGEKRRSFLPYKQDLVGFFANMNGLNRNLRPF